jgi:DnaJ-class molecular chaperone
LLALRHHPDRAGAGATEVFQRIAVAYQVLSDPAARSAYDARLRVAEVRRPEAPRADGTRTTAAPRPVADDLLARFAGALDELVAGGVVRRLGDELVELVLTADEARRGGSTALVVPVRLPCPTCGGCAQPGSIWCVRCEFAGTVREEVTVRLDIPAAVHDGATFTVPLDPREAVPPLRVRVRVPARG